MPEAALDIKIRTLGAEEAASGMDRLKLKIKEMAAEERASGGVALERFLKGGGALGLLTYAGEEFAKSAKGVTEALEGVGSGSLTFLEGVEKVGSSLPIIGGFVAAFSEGLHVLGEHFDGDTEKAKRLKAELELVPFEKFEQHFQTDEATAGLTGADKEKAEAEAKYQQQADDIAEKMAGLTAKRHLGMTEDEDNKILALRHKLSEDLAQAEEDKEKRLAAIDAEYAAKKIEETTKNARELSRIKLEAEISAMRSRGKDLAAQEQRFAIERNDELAKINDLGGDPAAVAAVNQDYGEKVAAAKAEDQKRRDAADDESMHKSQEAAAENDRAREDAAKKSFEDQIRNKEELLRKTEEAARDGQKHELPDLQDSPRLHGYAIQARMRNAASDPARQQLDAIKAIKDSIETLHKALETHLTSVNNALAEDEGAAAFSIGG